MKEPKPRTLIKTGLLERDLAEVVRAFDSKAIELKIGLANNQKFGVFDQTGAPYVLIVSKLRDSQPNSYGYNSIITVSSYDTSKAKRVVAEIERLAGVRYDKPVPSVLSKNEWITNFAFTLFLKHGEKAVDLWKTAFPEGTAFWDFN